MDWEMIEKKWTYFKDRVRQKWEKLDDEDMGIIEGKRHYLSGKIQEKYGLTKEEADRQIDDFSTNLH